MMQLVRATIVIGVLSIGAESVYPSVVYTDPADVIVTASPRYVDLDGDGTNDFMLYYGNVTSYGSSVAVGPTQIYGPNAVGSDYAGFFTTGYDPGEVVGAGDTMRNEASLTIFQSAGGGIQGAWATVGTERFAGVRMLRNGQFYYGWIRLRNGGGVTGMYLLDFAYETNPGEAIVMGAGVPIPGDVNGDQIVDTQDLINVLGAWGGCSAGQGCSADLNGDLVVDVGDLLFVLSNWS